MKLKDLFELEYSTRYQPIIYGNKTIPSKESKTIPTVKDKLIVRRTGKHVNTAIDGEGRKYFKKRKKEKRTGDPLSGANVSTSGGNRLGYSSGAGLGGTGASTPPKPQPEDVFDMDDYKDEIKGIDTTANHRTSKKKRKDLKRYLSKRLTA